MNEKPPLEDDFNIEGLSLKRTNTLCVIYSCNIGKMVNRASPPLQHMQISTEERQSTFG